MRLDADSRHEHENDEQYKANCEGLEDDTGIEKSSNLDDIWSGHIQQVHENPHRYLQVGTPLNIAPFLTYQESFVTRSIDMSCRQVKQSKYHSSRAARRAEDASGENVIRFSIICCHLLTSRFWRSTSSRTSSWSKVSRYLEERTSVSRTVVLVTALPKLSVLCISATSLVEATVCLQITRFSPW